MHTMLICYSLTPHPGETTGPQGPTKRRSAMKTRLKLSKTARAVLQGVRERLDVPGHDLESMSTLLRDAEARMIPSQAQALAHEVRRAKRSRLQLLKGAA